jgi:protein involved in polysaccharide export with SLBB domain
MDDQRDPQRSSDPQQRDVRRSDEPREPPPDVRRPEDSKNPIRAEEPRDARRADDSLDRRRSDELRDPHATGEGEQRLRTEIKRNFDEINWDYAVIERLNYDDLTTSLIPFNLGRAVLEGDASQNVALRPGDVVTIFSKVDIQVPVAKQTQYVRLEGELVTPGVYQILPGETLRQLLVRVGGLTATSYLYGAEFTRESVRVQQQKRLQESLDRLSAEVERNAATRAQSAPEAAGQAVAQAETQRRLLERLREIKATGRVVLEIPPDATRVASVPDIPLEDGDRLVVPVKPATVSVIGAVYNQNTFIFEPGRRVGDYLQNAGGTTRDADTGRVYVVRADGSVSGKASGSLFTAYTSERLEAGDTVVVPENLERYRFTRELKDWSQIFYQFALGVAGLKVLKDL